MAESSLLVTGGGLNRGTASSTAAPNTAVSSEYTVWVLPAGTAAVYIPRKA